MYRSTKGASKARRDQINAEIRNLKDLLPISEADKARLSYLHIMSLACMYTRKSVFFSQETETTGAGVESTRFMSFHELSQLVHDMPGFLLMVTSEGKLLYLSDSVTEHLGHSMVDLVAQGDSIYDIIDPTDHFVMRSNLAPATTPETDRLFRCRFNTSKSVRRQSAGSKLALVRAHCLSAAGGSSSYWTSNPVWLCFCSPLEGQASSSPVAQPAALPPPPADHAWFLAGFHSRHSQDMRVQEADDSVIVYLGYDVDALSSRSWYSLLHPQDLPHASAQHCSLLREGGEGRAEMVVRVETQDLSFTWLYMVLHLDTGENLIACRSYVVSESEAWSVRQQLCTEQTQLALVLSASASYQDSLGLQSPDTLSSPDQVFTPSSSGLSGQSFDFSAAASSLSSSEELGGAAAAESMQLEGPRSSLSSLEEEGFPQQGQQPPQPGESAVAPPSVTPPTTTSTSAELDFLFPPPSHLPLPPFNMPHPPQPVKDECACVCSTPPSAHAPRVGVSFTMGLGPLFNLSPTPSASAPTATRKAPPPTTVTMPLLASAWRPQLHLSLEPPSNCSRSGRGKYPVYEKLPPTPETPTGGVYEGDGGALLALPELQGPLYVELPPQGPFCCPLEGLLTPESSPAERPEVQPLCPKREGRSEVEIETERERERVEILNLAQHISYLADWFSPKLNTPSSIPAPLPEAPPAEQDPASPLGELYPVKPWRGGSTDTPVSRFPDNGSLFEENLLESLLLDLLSDSIPLPPPLPSSPSTPPPPNPPTPVCWCPPPPQLEVGSLVGISHLCSVQSTHCNCVGVGGALATVSAEEEAAEDSPPIPESLAAALTVAPAAPSILTCGQQPLPGEPVAVETEPMSGAGAPVAPVPGHQPELHQLQRDPSPQHFLPDRNGSGSSF